MGVAVGSPPWRLAPSSVQPHARPCRTREYGRGATKMKVRGADPTSGDGKLRDVPPAQHGDGSSRCGPHPGRSETRRRSTPWTTTTKVSDRSLLGCVHWEVRLTFLCSSCEAHSSRSSR